MKWTTITSKGRWDGKFRRQMLWIVLDDGHKKAVLYAEAPAPLTGNDYSQTTCDLPLAWQGSPVV